jgi:NTE family protein
MPPILRRKKKVGLALGSGAARGLAHLGVIEALRESGIHIDYLAGTSIGALVGAFLATNQINNLKEIALGLNWKEIIGFFDIVFPRAGLIDGKKISKWLKNYIFPQKIEELAIPFATVATDIISGKEVILDKGDVITAIRASISVPGIFTPIRINKYLLVDGGLINPVPVRVIRDIGAEIIIAINLSGHFFPKIDRSKERKGFHIEKDMYYREVNLKKFKKEINNLGGWVSKEPLPNIFEIILSSIYVVEQQITRYRLALDKPEVVIEPKVGGIGFLDFHRAPEMIKEGYQVTKKKIEEIKRLSGL